MGYYLKISNSERALPLLGPKGGAKGGMSPRTAIIKHYQSADLK